MKLIMLQLISQTLFGGYRRHVLGLLLLHPEQSYHVREIARLTGTVAGTLHKELNKLASAGILLRQQRGNQLVYSANQANPIYGELAAIMRKTSGIAHVIEQALMPVAAQIAIAFVFGSVARAQENENSDVDVMIIGALGFAEAVRLLYPVQATIGREINPKVFTVKEWRTKMEAGDSFVQDVVNKPKIFLIGDDSDFAKFSRENV
ncbi:nucleotidyltransferase domain-containing protein [Mycoavidus sp. HKI]|uniref:nucleotidyltransferase domain-containing protein n=1 Tax=Mycoavidus sp. HKI TaxID=2840467 RepID=UPI001CBD8982|nr:nucleotidyltransferase domain-containing protein [Mycoavidus sp. HKI]UAW65029.2 nucleotidyltransferase domain-containing protein [Mycoavidus sp. HKI]